MAKRFCARPASSKQRRQFKKDFPNLDIWFCPAQDGEANCNLGKNNIGDRMKGHVGLKDGKLVQIMVCGHVP